jgi:glutamyl-tRNA synthetase
VALTVAILANAIVDYDLVSDHNRRGCALGLPASGETTITTAEVGGDLAIARYIARRSASENRRAMTDFLGGRTHEGVSLVDQYVDYASSLSRLGVSTDVRRRRALAVRRTLDPALRASTYVIGNSMTLADVALFAALGFPSSFEMRAEIASMLPIGCPTLRWVETISSHPAIREATQLAVGISGKDEATFDNPDDATTALEPIMTGMNHLEGATPGNVTVRFPPEPSGYLHVGHAKAVLLSDYYARRYRGRLILRFDDTNPSKEKDEYQSSIVEDLAKIGVRPDVVTFTSDYFGTIEKYALWMIKNGLAYMDDTPQEEMQKERMDRQNSRHRDQSVSEALEYFDLMRSGSEGGSVWCLRAKIDMTSDNGTLRDPVLYRQNLTPHHRSGTAYKAYPTYDLACPIVDSIEGVTHALRTTEYDDRNAQFAWIQRALGLRRVRIQTFARMNFMYTVMSKRKLTWFVETGKVTGWDDPRFPTVRGVTRRGIDVGALKRFMCSQGASRRVVNMEWSKFWAENKKEIDKYAKRFMAIDKSENVPLIVTNAEDGLNFLTTDYLPKDPSFGKRLVRISKRVLLEKVDTEGMEVGENIVLTRWGA